MYNVGVVRQISMHRYDSLEYIDGVSSSSENSLRIVEDEKDICDPEDLKYVSTSFAVKIQSPIYSTRPFHFCTQPQKHSDINKVKNKKKNI